MFVREQPQCTACSLIKIVHHSRAESCLVQKQLLTCKHGVAEALLSSPFGSPRPQTINFEHTLPRSARSRRGEPACTRSRFAQSPIGDVRVVMTCELCPVNVLATFEHVDEGERMYINCSLLLPHHCSCFVNRPVLLNVRAVLQTVLTEVLC